MNRPIDSRETLLSRALCEGFDGVGAVSRRALGASAWIGAGETFGLVARTRPVEGLAPRVFPALYSATSQAILRVFGGLAPSRHYVPFFFEGPHPTMDGARAGVLVIGGVYPESFRPVRFPPGLYASIPPETEELLMISALEESGASSPVTETKAIWLVPVGEDGRALGYAGNADGVLLMVADRGAGPTIARMADRAFAPLLECGLFALGCLNAVTGEEESTLRTLSPPAEAPGGGGPYGGGGYALRAGDVLAALEERGRAAEDGLDRALRRCEDMFEFPEEDDDR